MRWHEECLKYAQHTVRPGWAAPDHTFDRGRQVRTLKAITLAALSSAVLAQGLMAQMATGKEKLVGVNGASATYSDGGSTTWTVYTSPYHSQFWVNSTSSVLPPSTLLPPAGVNAFGPATDVFCVDFNHDAYIGTTYNAYYTNLGTNAADIGTYTRSGHTLTQYLEAAWLASQISVVGASTGAAADINGAIWQIMSGSPKYRWTGAGWSGTGISSWVALAGGNWNTVNARDWVVVTDVNAAGKGWQVGTAGSQEFITQVTPEPATLLLLGTGILMLFGAGIVRRPLA